MTRLVRLIDSIVWSYRPVDFSPPQRGQEASMQFFVWRLMVDSGLPWTDAVKVVDRSLALHTQAVCGGLFLLLVALAVITRGTGDKAAIAWFVLVIDISLVWGGIVSLASANPYTPGGFKIFAEGYLKFLQIVDLVVAIPIAIGWIIQQVIGFVLQHGPETLLALAAILSVFWLGMAIGFVAELVRAFAAKIGLIL